jgi:hypothetical protein
MTDKDLKKIIEAYDREIMIPLAGSDRKVSDVLLDFRIFLTKLDCRKGP